MRYIAQYLLLLTTLSASLAGCDSIDGINSRKVVQKNADDTCVIQALKHTQGIKDIHPETNTMSGWLILGDGPQHGSQIRHFTYDTGTDYRPSLMIEDYGAGQYKFSHTMLVMNRRIPRTVIDYTLPIMIDAEKQIARSCDVEISTGMKHSCSGLPCGPD